jgi:23S rRNA-/tRNA-specific pseudouridylate synthase
MKMNKTRKYKRNFDKINANLMVIKIYEDLLHGFIDKDTKELRQVPADGPAGNRYKQLMKERNARPFATRRRRVIL